MLLEHCATVGRDVGEIDCSVNVMVTGTGDAEIAAAVDLAAGYRDVGVDIAVMNLPHGAPASLLDRLATGLAQL